MKLPDGGLTAKTPPVLARLPKHRLVKALQIFHGLGKVDRPFVMAVGVVDDQQKFSRTIRGDLGRLAVAVVPCAGEHTSVVDVDDFPLFCLVCRRVGRAEWLERLVSLGESEAQVPA